MNNPKPLIYDQDLQSLQNIIVGLGEKPYRAAQVWQGLYKNLWQSPEEFTMLSLETRQLLLSHFQFDVLVPIKKITTPDLSTEKTLFKLHDNQAIETVFMRYQNRNTVCISTQVGCGMGCNFCATGQMGYSRNLSSGEIVAQVIYYASRLSKTSEKLTNVVVMGMGEPFHNYEATLNAIDRLKDNDGFNFGERRFTISTVGLVPMIRKFAQEKRQINLAISLHAAENKLRSSLLPINKKYPLEDLFDACIEYISLTNRRITFEWALINSVNDTQEQAQLLAAKLKGMLCHVNLIPLNPTEQYSGRGSTMENAKKFKAIIESSGIHCTIRLRRGIDIQAGCGQLISEQI
jgi:23S rRNA (adenine2503-C2)-methyltransferase